MLDIKFLRENPDIVKENIKNKFQDRKLPLVDEVIALDKESRATQQEADNLRANRKKISKNIGGLMAQGKKEEAEALKAEVAKGAERLAELEKKEDELAEKIRDIMLTIPNIIDPSVPIGKDDSENVEIEKFGEPVVPDFDIPYHTEIMEAFDGIDLDAARDVAGNGFYYFMGDIARLHSAVIAYARDFMIDRGFTYCVPPFMIRSNVVTGVMSFDEMDAMMCWKGEAFLAALEQQIPLCVADLSRDSQMSNPDFEKVWRAGMEKDGSYTGFLYMDKVETGLEEAQGQERGLLRLGAGHVRILTNMLRARVGKGRELFLQGAEAAVQFKPGLQSAVALEEEALVLTLAEDGLEELCAYLKPHAGTCALSGVPLTLELVPTRIKDRDGNVIQVIE